MRFLSLILIALTPLILIACNKDPLKLAPFDAVHWRGNVAEVEVDGASYELLALDGIEAHDIVSFAQGKYGHLWQKRIEEDLIEILLRMGHYAGSTVNLRVRNLGTGEETVLNDVAMTSARRQKLWEARNTGGPSAPAATTREVRAKTVRGPSAPTQQGYPKLAPFTAVRWDGDETQIEVDDEWLVLLAIDGNAIADILRFAKKQFGSRWQKRFGEDLVQVLSEMGNEPGDDVELSLQALDGKRLEDRRVKMTAANRRAVLASNRGRRTPASSPRSTEPARRVERKHANKVPAEWRELFAPDWLDQDHEGWRTPELSRSQVEEDLDQLEWLLEDRFSYLELKQVDYRAALDAIRVSAADGMTRGAFAIQLMKLLALFGDGHTRSTDSKSRLLPPGSTTFLLEETDEGIVCFAGDRSGFLDEDHRFLEAIDGIEIEEWIAASATLSSGYSPPFARRQAIRNLRYLGWVAMELGESLADEITLTLTDGKKAVDVTSPVGRQRAAYGSWPRTASKILDGNIGYVRIMSMESDPAFIDALHYAMRACKDTDGLIIDVRGNGGGSRDALRTLFPYFMKKNENPHVVNLARYKLRADDPKSREGGYLDNRSLFPATWSGWSTDQAKAIKAFAKRFRPDWNVPKDEFSGWHYMLISPNEDAYHYRKPVKMLINGDCFSATDIFASAFKARPGIELIGTTTGGGSGRSRGVTLANSELSFRLSSMASFQKTGSLYDGVGVEPDVIAKPIPTDFLGRSDSVLDLALERLSKKR